MEKLTLLEMNKVKSIVQQNSDKLIVLKECNCNRKKIRHHPNYNKPLEIELLCRQCHWKEHERLSPGFNKHKNI